MGKDLKGKELGQGIRQRSDKRYEARAKIKGKDINLYNTDLKKLKEDFLLAKQKAEQDIDTIRSQMTLNEWFEEWFDLYKKPNIKPQSVYPMKNKYYSTFGKFIGDIKLIDIRNIDIQRVLNSIKEEGRATSTSREALGRIRECLESAKNNRIILTNPCFDVVVAWENKNILRRFLSREEQTLFLKHVENSWYKEMFYTMFLTGMRIGEIGGLMWQDIDFKNKCIHINRSLSCNYENGVKKMRLSTPKTQNSYRNIPFMGEVEEMLKSQKKKQEEIKKELAKRYRSQDEYTDLVFTSSLGSPIIRYIAEKEIKKAITAINQEEIFNANKENRTPVFFENMYPHAIRHTFCSRCFENGMNPKVVQSLMGHQHYSTTIDIYTHVVNSDFNTEITKYKSAVDFDPNETLYPIPESDFFDEKDDD